MIRHWRIYRCASNSSGLFWPRWKLQIVPSLRGALYQCHWPGGKACHTCCWMVGSRACCVCHMGQKGVLLLNSPSGKLVQAVHSVTGTLRERQFVRVHACLQRLCLHCHFAELPLCHLWYQPPHAHLQEAPADEDSSPSPSVLELLHVPDGGSMHLCFVSVYCAGLAEGVLYQIAVSPAHADGLVAHGNMAAVLLRGLLEAACC